MSNLGDVFSKLMYSNVSQTGVWGRIQQFLFLAAGCGNLGAKPVFGIFENFSDFCTFLEKKLF